MIVETKLAVARVGTEGPIDAGVCGGAGWPITGIGVDASLTGFAPAVTRVCFANLDIKKGD